jgi:myo-inositol-hexaphosphate 3-phosphohydrolase
MHFMLFEKRNKASICHLDYFVVMCALNINQYINQIFTKHKKRSTKIYELKNQLLKEFREQNHSKVDFRIEFALFGVDNIIVGPAPKVMWGSNSILFFKYSFVD